MIDMTKFHKKQLGALKSNDRAQLDCKYSLQRGKNSEKNLRTGGEVVSCIDREF